MDTKQPLVSVCMITYNHEKFIEEAILGVLKQQIGFDVELLISNDCSADNTHAIIKNAITLNKNKNISIRYFNHKKNKGMMSNLLFTLGQCRGRYIAFCEGDDYWIASLKLQKQIDVLEANDAYSFCGHQNLIQINENLIEHSIPTGVQKFKDIIQRNFIATSALVVRSETISKCPDFFRNAQAGDWLLQLLALKSGDALVLKEFMSVYRKHDGGIWSSKSHYEMGIAGIRLLQSAKKMYTDKKAILLINQAILKREKAYGIHRIFSIKILSKIYKYFKL